MFARNSKCLQILPLLLAVGLLGPMGCISFNQDYPSVAAYVLQVERPEGESAGGVSDSVLKVRAFRAEARYAGTKLIYKKSGERWVADFYHEWFVAPGQMLANSFEEWVSAAGIFAEVVESTSMANATHLVEGSIKALYGDFSDPAAPRAVLGLNLVVLSDPRRMGGSQILMNRQYRAEVPLEDANVQALLEGYRRALVQVLTEAEADLADLPPVTDHEPYRR